MNPGAKLRLKQLPILEDLMNQLASQGLCNRGIAGKLSEDGINVSYKTIQRVLAGQSKVPYRRASSQSKEVSTE